MTSPTSTSAVELRIEGRVAHLTLTGMVGANALSESVVDLLRKGLVEAHAQGAVVVVLRSSGRVFCGGFDLSQIDQSQDADLRRRFVAIEELLADLRDSDMLTIAVVEGAAIGAGADIVASCDYRIGTSKARFRFPGVRFGLLLGSTHLAKIVAPGAAADLLIRNVMVHAPEARSMGILTHLRAPEDLDALIADACAGPQRLPPEVLPTLLRVIRGRAVAEPMKLLERSMAASGLRVRLQHFIEAETHERQTRKRLEHEQ